MPPSSSPIWPVKGIWFPWRNETERGFESMTILDALKQGDRTQFERLLEDVEDIDAVDEQGWTLLNWAAGRGDLASVESLLARGADVFKRGRDDRTAYLIALAAGHRDVVEFLKQAEESSGGDTQRNSSRQGERRAYCRGYAIGSLREFGSWKEDSAPSKQDADSDSASGGRLSDDEVVFLHHDFSVTQTVLHGQKVLFESQEEDWKRFCRQSLGFKVPSDLDLITVS